MKKLIVILLLCASMDIKAQDAIVTDSLNYFGIIKSKQDGHHVTAIQISGYWFLVSEIVEPQAFDSLYARELDIQEYKRQQDKINK